MTPPRPTSGKHTWKVLFKSALRIIDSLEGNGYGKLDFRLGGGTVLMFRFDHRVSKDIDIFTHDAQALSYLSPIWNMADTDRERARDLFRRSLIVNPNSAMALTLTAWIETMCGIHLEARDMLARARLLNPRDPQR